MADGLGALPTELWEHILSFAAAGEWAASRPHFCAARAVCRAWRDLATALPPQEGMPLEVVALWGSARGNALIRSRIQRCAVVRALDGGGCCALHARFGLVVANAARGANSELIDLIVYTPSSWYSWGSRRSFTHIRPPQVDYLHRVLEGAAEGGHETLLRQAARDLPRSVDEAIRTARGAGVTLGFLRSDAALLSAAGAALSYGQIRCAYACRQIHDETFAKDSWAELLNTHRFDTDRFMARAAARGHFGALWGGHPGSSTFIAAISAGRLDMVRYLYDWQSVPAGWYMSRLIYFANALAKCGCADILRLCRERGAPGHAFNEALAQAAINRRPDLVSLCFELGARHQRGATN